MKKFLSFMLAAMLAFGFTACAQNGGTDSSENGSEVESTQQESSSVNEESSSEKEEDSTEKEETSSIIEFVNSKVELEIGESVQLEVKKSKNVFIFWDMIDKSIAEVNQITGEVTALAAGETVCTATAAGETVMCIIKVKEKGAAPELSVSVPYYESQVSLYAGAELALNTIVKLGDAIATDAAVTYEVTDTQIATVENGKVIGAAVGTTTILITATYNGQTAMALVDVQVMGQAQTIESIKAYGQQTTFTIGDKFIFGGFVDVTYGNGTVEEKVDYYTVDTSKYDATKVGTYEIKVIIGEAAYTYNVTVEKSTTLRILMIGNSFSQDTVMWMPQIAKSLGFTKIEVATIMKGGCTMEQHYDYATNNKAEYEFLYGDGNSWTTYKNYTMQQGLRFAEWDFVTLQQQSGNSGNVASYNSHLDGLIDYVKANALKRDAVKLVWHMTWAYPAGSSWFGGLYDNDQMKMYNAITSAVQEKIVTNDNFCLIAPTGTAIQNGRTSYIGDYYPGEGEAFVNTVDEWNRDGAHLSQYEGRFTSSLSMFCTVTGYTPDEISYNPTNVDAAEARVIRESVKNALANPFAVTKSNY